MASFLTKFKHLEIKLEDIKSATNNFDEKNVIGHGGFGKVYEGKLAFPHSEGEILVALKRLDRKYGQGDPEFYKEIRFLSCYRHENLISLLGFCNQDGEMILVYEHASGGSLDRFLNSAALTWQQRLKICLDAAKGISFLHDPNGAHQRVLHCDIKSANILLDKNMNAKVSDFGLSKIGPANQQYSALITNAAGTPGYCDPLFMKTYCLTKESDVYSFGVLLFEVLCGRLCAEFSNGQLNIFVPMWKKSYKEKKLDDIIFKDLKQQMDQKSLETFAGIAFQCLQKYREQRPPMSLVVQKLKIALQFQDPVSFNFSDSLEIIKDADTSLTYKGLLVNGGKTALVDSYEKKVDDTDKRSEETNKISEERLKQALDAETQIMQLKMAMQRLQEKVSDVTSKNQILRQQAFSSPTKHVPENANTPETNSSVENGLGGSEEPQARARKSVTESHSKPKKSLIDLQHDNLDALIECVMRDTGFSRGKHVAAFTIYKCLLHWESFEAEKTSVFDRLIQMIGSAIENEDNNEHMAYWLSNTSALVFLIQKSLKPEGASSVQKSPHPTSLFGRMTMGLRSSSVSLAAPAAALEVVRQVEAKYPALLFKQQLTAYIEKIYGIVRDNLKKELGSLLSLCIQAPRASKGVRRSGMSFGKDSQSSHWQGIVGCLNTFLKTSKDNFVPPIIVQKIFCQVFSYINVQLFNSLLLRRECCSFSNGEYVKAGLAELELWCCEAKEEYVGSAWDELKHVRQAIGFLVIYQKFRISYDGLTKDLCPVLSVQQLYRICTLYWDDKHNTKSVSPEHESADDRGCQHRCQQFLSTR